MAFKTTGSVVNLNQLFAKLARRPAVLTVFNGVGSESELGPCIGSMFGVPLGDEPGRMDDEQGLSSFPRPSVEDSVVFVEIFVVYRVKHWAWQCSVLI